MPSESTSGPGPVVPGELEPTGPSGPASRRAFLVRSGAIAAGATALGAGLLNAGPAQASTRPQTETDTSDGDVSGESVVAYVSDAATGEITIMSGDREISVTDHRLARALVRKVS
jgi:hypothetical protein